MFTTEHLQLRGFESSDARRILDLWNNVDVQPAISNEYIVPRGPKFMDKIAAWVEDAVMFLTIETRAMSGSSDETVNQPEHSLTTERQFVGTTSITMSHPKNRDGIFGITLEPEFWGRGYGEEVTRFVVAYCFHSLGLHRISLMVFGGNERALNLYEKVAFVEEGRKRKVNWTDGHWEDMIYMGLLKEEWEVKDMEY
ncbi:acyl-CoA N-acyltransferase [Lentinula aciculospora]|uniref:Acyl-CoA N-acyltransferase n=1 Tax=Lentinula aciculospora TaxID=153920 RepID=A0A9W9DP75_9AGAR|nr:acyl-CoA N-acyltransferase [Lentinula aciculospora]KAJ4487643.1 acyl-CoA N-acyltransferase [Lentinula aciculospora]KAJ4487648.1 acyl-CoA N-acyltransferase [Lentinula aciculospora]